jgi:glycosyltransferase involved in cell wall biosynthesis
VFFPAYNDAYSLPGLVESAFEVLEDHVRDYEIIVVNDGSADGTGELLEDMQGIYGPRLRVVTHTVNKGYGGALRSGFAAATKEFVFYTDGDGQYDVRELPVLLRKVTADVDLVNGYKTVRQDPRHRIWIGEAYNWFARRLFRVKLRDIDCDFRLIRRERLRQYQFLSTSGTVCVELVKLLESAPGRVEEAPVSHLPRLYGRSQFFRIRSLAVTFFELLQLYWLTVARPALTRRPQPFELAHTTRAVMHGD